jgi:hypothetical protein
MLYTQGCDDFSLVWVSFHHGFHMARKPAELSFKLACKV